MQGKQSHSFAVCVSPCEDPLSFLLDPPFFPLPCTVLLEQPRQQASTSGTQAGDYGNRAHFQPLTASQLLPSTCVLIPQKGPAQLHRCQHPRPGPCVTFSVTVSQTKLWPVLTCTEIDTNSPGQADSLNLMAVGRGCHPDMQPFQHQVQLRCLVQIRHTDEPHTTGVDTEPWHLTPYVPPCCVLTWMMSEGGPSPTEVKARTRMLYVVPVMRLPTVVRWLSSVLCFCHMLKGRCGSVV